MSADHENSPRLRAKVTITLTVLAASGVLGMAAFSGLSALYTPPLEKPRPEIALEVETLALQPQSYTMRLRGWGEAKSIGMTPISSKVPGEVVAIHPNLKMGNVIEEGEVLIQIEDTDLRLLRGQAESQLKQAETAIARLKAQFELDSGRLETVRRSMELARTEFEKDKHLYEERNVGSQSMVNASELNYNKARDAYDQVKNALELFPKVLEEAESGLNAARLQLEKVELDLSRTKITAPYTGRVKLVQVEIGQTVGPGIPLVIFANDSALEISVALDSYEARQWLRFSGEPANGSGAWFGEVAPADCTVYWTENHKGASWKGVLNRVERYDQMTRTVFVTVRVPAENAVSQGDGLPLVDGMFCEVEIEGRTLENVYAVPRGAVSFENEVYVAGETDSSGEYRLQRLQVEVLGGYGDDALLSPTLPAGTRLVITKLQNPLRNSLLKFMDETREARTGASGETGG